MKFHFKFFSLFIFCCFASYLTTGVGLQKMPVVRVLLSSQNDCDYHDWNISSDCGFILKDPRNLSKKFKSIQKKICVSVKDGFLHLNEARFLKKQFFIFPQSGLLSFGGNFYKGSFLVVLDDEGRVQLINCVDLEDYVFAVLRSESWPGWPLEVNKVFAIATRTYVIRKIRESKKSGRLFHIKNTKIHQTYNGHKFMIRNSKMLKQAVYETSGVFLAHEGEPILAMFDSCCGGIIPSKIEGFEFKKAPYLAREYACEHCKRCKIYRWKIEYDRSEWTKILSRALPDLKKLSGIRVTKRDEAGLIREIVVEDKKHTYILTGKQLYSLLDAVKSFCFFVSKKENKIVLKGRGYGHHLGLCQWGAREMVRDEWDYRKILKFYYPGTEFARLI